MLLVGLVQVPVSVGFMIPCNVDGYTILYCIHACMHACMHACIHTYIHIYILYIYIYKLYILCFIMIAYVNTCMIYKDILYIYIYTYNGTHMYIKDGSSIVHPIAPILWTSAVESLYLVANHPWLMIY